MRCEHERLFQTRGIDYLQHKVKSMTMQFIGVMHLNKLHTVMPLIRQILQGIAKGTFPAMGKTYDGYSNHAAKVLLFCDMCNPIKWGF